MELTSIPAGNFCWADLSTTDANAAKKFYAEILGWSYDDNPMGEGQVYSMCLVDGKQAGALYQDNSGRQPPHWTTYVAVENADASAAKARDLGGNVLMDPFDVFDAGRMTFVQDPTGAIVAAWQPVKHQGFRVAGEPGAVCWSELNTRDTAKAAAFYEGLFGWVAKTSDMGEMKYTEFQNNGQSIGGMMQIQPEWGPDVPPHWLTYFIVADVDAAVTKASGLGGRALVNPMDIPNVGRFAVLMDPQGAVFAVFK